MVENPFVARLVERVIGVSANGAFGSGNDGGDQLVAVVEVPVATVQAGVGGAEGRDKIRLDKIRYDETR